MADEKYERFNEAVLSRLLLETKQSAAAAVERATELLAEREVEVAELRSALIARLDERLGQVERDREREVEIERLRADNHHMRGLLETAVDAWECGQAVTNRQGVVLADFRGACLPKAWWDEARKAGGDDA